ncbi:MAG: S-layer homology domain-containing protein [Actinomycetota bacterium]
MVGFRHLRVVVALALGAAALTAAPPASGHAGFGDVGASAFYTEAVQWMVDNEITTGTAPGCFSPDDIVTRGQAAAFMWRMEGEPAAPAHSFTDITAAYQQAAVSWMAANEITTGTTPSTYSPDDFLTRGQLAALLWRLAGNPAAPAHAFSDVHAGWQQGAVSWMAANAITTGTTPSTFAPDDFVTRGQLAAFFYRYQDEPPVTVDDATPLCGGPADDEFDDGPVDLLADGASEWQVLNGATADVIDIDSSAAGSLVIVPRDFHNNGWFATSEGPFVYQNVTGDFAAAIRITVGAADDPDAAPGNGYNSGGFVLRDGAQPHDWVMFNIGGQTSATGFAREVKTTVNGSSVLQLESIATREYRLLICRVGAEIRYFTGTPDTTSWTQDHIEHTRADFGQELQIGIVANAWESDPRPWVEVERVHFGRPSGLADCTDSVAAV